jgi:hypothetical protein
MSYTGFKLDNVSLHFLDGPLVVAVSASSDEPKIARLIAFIDVDAVQFQARLIPSIKREHVTKKRGFVSAPGFM